ncbi:hypothetical protein NECAME_12144 [Necator americanus]|uniref:Endonuclease/exonuclease/phosphatase domain-containing protein n=1 Tax=Necator americanus TaxID=51031 RepID=W2T499_NECAM|nr:hypothetical protein NECAME_12144 [Necator americanus]ETN75772.1 hypothetical protein NECAME_12144 [Necator americanus]
MTISTYNARTLASEAAIEDLMMQAKKIKYDVIGLTETRRHPLNAAYKTGEELFLGTCDSRGVGGVGVEYGKEHRLFRTTYPIRTSADGKMWSISSFEYPKKKKSKLSISTWRSSAKKIMPSTRSYLAISMLKLAQEERLRNFTSGPTAYNGMKRGRGSPSSS